MKESFPGLDSAVSLFFIEVTVILCLRVLFFRILCSLLFVALFLIITP